MATIQIRNVPDSVHHVYQVRAATARMSLQEYMLAELVRGARKRTPAEIVIEVERNLHAGGAEGFSEGSSAGLVAADRESH